MKNQKGFPAHVWFQKTKTASTSIGEQKKQQNDQFWSCSLAKWTSNQNMLFDKKMSTHTQVPPPSLPPNSTHCIALPKCLFTLLDERMWHEIKKASCAEKFVFYFQKKTGLQGCTTTPLWSGEMLTAQFVSLCKGAQLFCPDMCRPLREFVTSHEQFQVELKRKPDTADSNFPAQQNASHKDVDCKKSWNWPRTCQFLAIAIRFNVAWMAVTGMCIAHCQAKSQQLENASVGHFSLFPKWKPEVKPFVVPGKRQNTKGPEAPLIWKWENTKDRIVFSLYSPSRPTALSIS